MTTVTVKLDTDAKDFRVAIDNVRLVFGGQTTITKTLPKPGKHFLSWTVIGTGLSISVEITAPPTAVCKTGVKNTTESTTSGGTSFKTK